MEESTSKWEIWPSRRERSSGCILYQPPLFHEKIPRELLLDSAASRIA